RTNHSYSLGAKPNAGKMIASAATRKAIVLCAICGRPERQISRKQRRTVPVIVERDGWYIVFWIVDCRKFSAALKESCSAVLLLQRLSQELNDRGVKIVADEDLGRRSDQRYVIRWIGRVELHNALWQNEAHKIRKHPQKSIGRRKVHEPNIGITQQTF